MASNTFAWRNSENEILWLGQREVSDLNRSGDLPKILGFSNEKEMREAQNRIAWEQEQSVAQANNLFDGNDWKDGGGNCLAL